MNLINKYKINPTLPNGYEKMKAVDLPKDIVKDKILYFNAGITDKEGNLWMTTYGDGVWKYDGKTLKNIEVKKGKEKAYELANEKFPNPIIILLRFGPCMPMTRRPGDQLAVL